MTPEPVAVTARLRLRELQHADAAFVMELVNDADWLRYIGDRNVRTLDDARGYVDRVRSGYAAHGFGLWVAESLADGDPLGLSGLLRRDTLAHPDLGFAFLPRARGRGIAREAAEAVLRLAHERHGIGRVLAITVPANAASRRLLEQVGFRLEGQVPDPANGEELCLYGRDLP